MMEHVTLPTNANKKSNVGLDSFLTVSVIGKGSYAKVILVKKKETGEYYAMKVLKKINVEQKKQENHVQTERNILVEMKGCPFLIDFSYSFQTKEKLFFVLEYCPGGELFNLLQKRRRFTEEQTRFYAAQMVIALEYLHKRGIIYRDLKPENVLIDSKGYIKITDFGLSRMNVKNNEAKSICGTPEYLAPEIILKLGYGKPVDWWTLGSIVYEMLFGVPPFYTNNRQELFERIKFLPPKYPNGISPTTKAFLEGLLRKDPSKRLGSISDAEEIKEHPWFAGINWQYILEKKYEAPFVPRINNDMGLNNFDPDFTEIPIHSLETPLDMPTCKVYNDFSWNEEIQHCNKEKTMPETKINLEPIGEKNEAEFDSRMIEDDD